MGTDKGGHCPASGVPADAVSTEGLLPVLVHVHGGSNEVGMGAMFDGDVLASLGEIIVITFNYRLGAFGFLSGEDEVLPGNYGLYDQTMAFRWVKDNIQYFGGLFRYAVMQSGSPLAYWALLHPPASTLPSTREFVQRLGCGGTSSMATIKACLKKLSWKDINGAQYMYVPGLYNFSPVVDGRFILDTPERALQNLPINGKAFMTGITRDEGSLTAQVILQTAEKDQRQFRFEEDNPKDYTPPPVQAFSMIPGISHLVFHEYKPWDDPYNKTANLVGVSHLHGCSSQVMGGITEGSKAGAIFIMLEMRMMVVGDSTFVAPAVELANLLSGRVERTYLYTFNHVSRFTKDPLWMGVPHGRDLFYLFGCPFSGHPLHNYSQVDKNVSRKFIQLWSNFVKHGRPFLDDPDNPFTPYDERNQSYIVVANNGNDVVISNGKRLRSRKVAFWNNLLPKLRKPEPEEDDIRGALTWVFVAMTSVLLVVVVILSLCVAYFRRLAHDRCIVHANDEKSSCQL
nr:hypothetical protein BaRGS_010974 [Batillaria attramentaria]